MRITSILCHLAYDQDHRARLRVAHDLARRFQAHLKAVYVGLPVDTPGGVAGRGASYAYIQEVREAESEHAQQVRRELETQCHQDGLSHSWVFLEGEHLGQLTAHTPCVDLAVVSRVDKSTLEQRLSHDLPQHLPLYAACPVLVLPYGHDPEMPLGQRVGIAWQYTRAAGRAVREALPVLDQASSVSVTTVLDKAPTDAPLAPVTDHLARHGIEATAEPRVRQGHESDAHALLDHCRRYQADLLVMGGYGRTGFRQMMRGSVTDHVLATDELPVLLSH